ncbi:hypothetical protein V3481_012274 [Fusarium oxysporum f. sp. vasinfectum]
MYLSDEDTPCQPDGEFRFKGRGEFIGFNWWAARGFFQITLGWGRLDFGAAKLIDVVWDLIVGRGGQTVMALVSWRVFAEYLQVSLTTKPATYSTVWLIRFQKENSAFAIWKLASGFFKIDLASKKAMCFMIWTALFILAFPTFASSMTGYTPYNKAYVNSTTGKLVQFSEVLPVAYVIRDGDRVDGLSKDYPVLWKGNSTTAPGDSSVSLFDMCDDWNNVTDTSCELQRDVSNYTQLYGFEAKSRNKTQSKRKTYFRNQTLDWPPLNITAFYLPDEPFYWNWTANRTEMYAMYSSIEEINSHPYGNRSKSTFLIEDELYNYKELQAAGICQPMKGGESIEYQWGFSFLQLFVMTSLLHLWSIGLVILWTTAHLTLKRNNLTTSSEGWKGLLEITDSLKVQLESAGIILNALTDKELDDEIQLLLTGGPISTSAGESEPETPLSQGYFSIWKWMWKHKWRLFKGSFFVIIISLENILRASGLLFGLDKMLFWMAVVSYTIASLIVACCLGSTHRQRLFTFLTAIVLCFPFFWYNYKERDLVLPGLCLGACLALLFGSSRGSRAVLFVIPVLCNYFPVLGYFISRIKEYQRTASEYPY